MKRIFTLFALLLSLTGCYRTVDIEPAPEQFSGNASAVRVGDAVRHDALARLDVLTNAPELVVTAQTNFPAKWLSAANIICLVDSVYTQTFTFTQPGQDSFVVQLPGGRHRVTLVESTQLREAEHGALGFTSITRVSVRRDYAVSIVTPKRHTTGAVIWGDSRSVGGGYLDAGRWAWPLGLAAASGADVYMPGYCSMQLGAHIGTQAKRDSLTQAIVYRLKDYNKQIVYIQAGVNDYGYAGATPSQLRDAYRLWLPQLHKALPAAKIYVETDGPKADEKPNAAGFTLDDYRAAEKAGAEGFAEVVNGMDMWTLSDVADGTHLSQQGDAKRVPKVQAIIQ